MFSQKKALFPSILILISIVMVFFAFFQIDYRYDYAQFEKKINSSFYGNTTFSQSGEISLDGKSVSYVIAFDKNSILDADSIVIIWDFEGKRYIRKLDTEDDDTTGRLFTFPFVTDKKGILHYNIISSSSIQTASLIVTELRKTPFVAMKSLIPDSNALVGGIHIIRRAEWGADESIRYWSDTALEKQKKLWNERGQSPQIITETESEAHDRELEIKRGDRIREIRGNAAKVTSLTRYENGKKLIWPIKKTEIVDRIVIHHTAENLEQDVDDATLLRAIYAYHARTRGWGDIGYNYIIGQRGQIYEGRAGGDYVEGAHAYVNNLGSVGISVIGNFEKMNLNRDQRRGLEEAIVYFAKKYGINILDSTTGVRLCKSGGDCLLDEQTVYRLHGHRDIGYTSCPGENLYRILDELRTELAPKIGHVTPIKNPNHGSIDKIPSEDMVEYRLKEVSDLQKILTKPTIQPRGGKLIKIRLSYPKDDEIILEGPLYKNPDIRIDNKKIKSEKGTSMKIHTSGNNKLSVDLGGKTYEGFTMSFSSDIVRINSWSRIPTWDTNRQYNDNTFRGKIIVRNVDGKLLVVNELPLESYLKGLGEVSNGDPEEKIKTIIVAARSYARFYTDPKNRKYNTALYDGSDDPDSFQKYLGYSYESRSPRVSSLVDQTRSEIVFYNGEPVKTWYFSSSDGATLSYEQYCKNSGSMNCKNIPYFQSVEDPGGIGKTRSGHGVGISGIGATYFAGQGWDYKKIIQYYMKGVEIKKK